MASCDNQFSAALQSFMIMLTIGLTIQQSQPQLMKILCSLPILRSQAMLVVGSGKSFFILTAMWNTSKIHVLDDSFMFSLRKSRWAVIKDEKIYERVTRYMLLNTMGVSRDTQLRVLKLIKAMIEAVGREDDIFEFGHRTMRERWSKLISIVSTSNRFSLQKLSPQFCSYFKKSREPSPGE